MDQTVAIPATKSQNSAALLSVWHIVFSRFFSNCEDEYRNKNSEGLMEKIYANLKTVSLPIFQAEDEAKTKTKTKTIDPKITSPFRELFNIVSDEIRWIEELKSMMKEVTQSKTVLSFLKEYYQFPEVSSYPFEKDPNNEEQFKKMAHLITVWYWLITVWSSGNQPGKNDFVEAVENKYSSITKMLFHKTSAAAENQQKEDITDLVKKLFDTLRNDPQRWFAAMDNFRVVMLQVGYGYQFIEKQRQHQYLEQGGPNITLGMFGVPLKKSIVALPWVKDAAVAAAKELAPLAAWEAVEKAEEEYGIFEKILDVVVEVASITLMANPDTEFINDDINTLALTAGRGMRTFIEEEVK